MKVLLMKSPDNYEVGVSLILKDLGAFEDPNDYLGMAHFLEVLFFSTLNY